MDEGSLLVASGAWAVTGMVQFLMSEVSSSKGVASACLLCSLLPPPSSSPLPQPAAGLPLSVRCPQAGRGKMCPHCLPVDPRYT
jgi:hypothetical protein